MAKQGHSYNSGRINRAAKSGGPAPAWGDEYLPPPVKLKRERRWPKVLLTLGMVVVFLAGLVFVGYRYLGEVFEPGELGRITPGANNVPQEYSKKEVIHLLIAGIDNEEGRSYGAGLGLTDMLLYARFDLVNNKLNLMQVPRDSYVGESYSTGGTGKINALLISGSDKDHPINNLVGPFTQLFQLPVDHYIALDMDAMKAIVDAFGGIRVYVSQEMSYDGSYLPQGWQWLNGDAAEFFVRNRHGSGFARGDIDRLDNQRHFYSALFRRFLNMTPIDLANLLPVFDHYCNTDLEFGDLLSLAVSGLKLKAESVLFCKVPGATGPELDPSGAGRSMYFIDVTGRGTEEEPGLAELLNRYFRDADQPVAAEALQLPRLNLSGYTLYPPNVQVMSDVQEGEGGADVDVEPPVG